SGRRRKRLAPLIKGRSGRWFVSVEQARTRRRRLQRRINRVQSLIVRLRKMLERAGLPGRQPLSRWAKALRLKGLQAQVRERTLNLYQPFVWDNRYICESANIRSAYALLSEKDRQTLPWDPEQIDWEKYWIENQIKGIEKWIEPEVVKDQASKA